MHKYFVHSIGARKERLSLFIHFPVVVEVIATASRNRSSRSASPADKSERIIPLGSGSESPAAAVESDEDILIVEREVYEGGSPATAQDAADRSSPVRKAPQQNIFFLKPCIVIFRMESTVMHFIPC